MDIRKGSLVFIEKDIPAFVSDKSFIKGKMPVYKFTTDGGGFEDIPLEDIKETHNIKEWLEACRDFGFGKEHIIDKMKWLGIRSSTINIIKGQSI